MEPVETMSLSKVAVVTGGNKGIGFAIVQELCRKFNGDVFLTARSDARGREAVQQISSKGMKVKFHQLDVNDLGSIQTLQDAMTKSYGGIDVLVNNAGILFKKEDPTPVAEQAQATLQTNYFGTLNVSNCLLPIMKKGGRVVNVSSQLCFTALQQCSNNLQSVFQSDSITESELSEKMHEYVELAKTGQRKDKGYAVSSYGVSKIGVTVLSRIQAREMVAQNRGDILINSCCPGWVKTDLSSPMAERTPEEGADTPVYLALLPEGALEPQGEFLLDRQIRKW